MSAFIKLESIAAHMDLEPTGEPYSHLPSPQSTEVAPCGVTIRSSPKQARQQPQTKHEELGVSPAVVSGGKTIPLLKTMLTTACERNCFYCPFRAGRSYKRQTFKPDEMAKTFMQMVKGRAVEGLFLSSGIIKGGVTTQDKLIDTADILRRKYRYRGYIHLKVMPGVEKDQLERAMQLASRLSVNLEGPNEARLDQLAPKKEFFRELVQPLKWIEEIRRESSPHRNWNGRWPSSVTQFVVGGVGESDLELLSTSEQLIKQYRLQRVYYSAFRPISDTPMENLPAENPMRQHRLYQSSYLFRDYGYDLEEMPFDMHGNLPLNEDPKMAWANQNLLNSPLELNRADRNQLLRVPGIGPKSADQILAARHRGRLRSLTDLRKLGIATKRVQEYVLLDGRRPARQLSLFAM